jgi:hypothetical protein
MLLVGNMKKNKLEKIDGFNLVVFGICTFAKEYKLAWHINKNINIKLKKEEDYLLEIKDSGAMLISNFKFELEHCIFRLLKNKLVQGSSENNVFLIKDLKQFDFLLTIANKSDTFNPLLVGASLRDISEIILIQSVDTIKLKEKENLIF